MINLMIKILSRVTSMVTLSKSNKKIFIAKSLGEAKFKQRIVRPKKGKGSFKRKTK